MCDVYMQKKGRNMLKFENCCDWKETVSLVIRKSNLDGLDMLNVMNCRSVMVTARVARMCRF